MFGLKVLKNLIAEAVEAGFEAALADRLGPYFSGVENRLSDIEKNQSKLLSNGESDALITQTQLSNIYAKLQEIEMAQKSKRRRDKRGRFTKEG